MNALFFGMTLLMAVHLHGQAVNPSQESSFPIHFEGACPDLESEARRLISLTIDRFQKTLLTETEPGPLRIGWVHEFGTENVAASVAGHMQGITLHQKDESIIKILYSAERSGGRVLVHELTHVLIHKTFGNTRNHTLNEGFAEYMAGKEFPSLVRRDMRSAEHDFVTPVLRPYVDGYRFCQRFAAHKNFPAFFERHILSSKNDSYHELLNEWRKEEKE